MRENTEPIAFLAISRPVLASFQPSWAIDRVSLFGPSSWMHSRHHWCNKKTVQIRWKITSSKMHGKQKTRIFMTSFVLRHSNIILLKDMLKRNPPRDEMNDDPVLWVLNWVVPTQLELKRKVKHPPSPTPPPKRNEMLEVLMLGWRLWLWHSKSVVDRSGSDDS